MSLMTLGLAALYIAAMLVFTVFSASVLGVWP